MIAIGPRRTSFDTLAHGVAWVHSVSTRTGPRVLDAGLESTRDFLERKHSASGSWRALLGQGRADVILRGPEVQIQRIDLPGITRAEARRVATRRKQELEQSEFGEDVFVSTLLVAERRGGTLWLMSALREVCEAVDFDVTRRGLRVDRLVPHTLALGAMTRTLPPPRSKGLTAVLWLDPDVGTCVVADERGWLFDRSISLKYAGDRLLHADDEAADAEQEEEYQQVERLATELERTFTYVERQLGLGEVVRMRLCGIAEGLDDLARTLAANLRLEVVCLGTARRGETQPSIPPAAGAALGAAMLPRPAHRVGTRLHHDLASCDGWALLVPDDTKRVGQRPLGGREVGGRS
jgi:hypothetical protein